MKKLSLLIAVVGFLIAATTIKPKKVTVQGHLVDTKCYGMGVNMDKPALNYQNNHMVPNPKNESEMMKIPSCATACANLGIPVGIVDGSKPGNKTYVLITPANQLANYMDKEARVEGMAAYDGNGIIPQKVEVKEDGKWIEVKIGTMM